MVLRRWRHRRRVAVVREGGRVGAAGIVGEAAASGASAGVVSGGAAERGLVDKVGAVDVVGGGRGGRGIDIDTEVDVGGQSSTSSWCGGGATWDTQLGDVPWDVGEAQDLADRILPMPVVVVVDVTAVEVMLDQSRGCFACVAHAAAAAAPASVAVDDARGYDSRRMVGADSHNCWRARPDPNRERRGRSSLGCDR